MWCGCQSLYRYCSTENVCFCHLCYIGVCFSQVRCGKVKMAGHMHLYSCVLGGALGIGTLPYLPEFGLFNNNGFRPRFSISKVSCTSYTGGRNY